MMKTFFYLLLSLAFVNCNAQNSEFENYLSNFTVLNFPFALNNDNHSESYGIFWTPDSTKEYGENTHTYKSIPEKTIDRYVCSGGFCNSHAGYFRYDYGGILDYSSDFHSVIVKKNRYEGNTRWDFDLMEILLITYNKEGKILSRKSISKDNEFWQNDITFSKDSISVFQIKITSEDIDKDELSCEYWTTYYRISDNGKIEVVKITPVSKGIAVMNKQNYSYKLK